MPPLRSEPRGFAVKTILIGVVWAILFGSALGHIVKYGLELSHFVNTEQTVPHEGAVRIGVYNWPGYYPVVVAKQAGLFDKYGVNVELVKASSNTELNDWLRTGRTEASVGTLPDFVILRALGARIRMMITTDYSVADVVLAQSSIHEARNLSGKKIGLSELTSFAEYFLIRTLELSGVNTRSVKFYTIAPNKVPEAILAGKIDAGHTRDPFALAGQKRGLRVSLSSEQNPRLVIEGIAFRPEVIKDANGDIRIPLAVSRAVLEAIQLQKNDPATYSSLSAKYFSIPTEDAQKFSSQDVRYTDLDENIHLYSLDGLLRKEAREISKFYGERGMSIELGDIQHLVDDSAVLRMEDERTIGEWKLQHPEVSSVADGTRGR